MRYGKEKVNQSIERRQNYGWSEKKQLDKKKYVRYPEGAEMYSMGLSKFQQIAKDAKAIYKVGRLVLVKYIY